MLPLTLAPRVSAKTHSPDTPPPFVAHAKPVTFAQEVQTRLATTGSAAAKCSEITTE